MDDAMDCRDARRLLSAFLDGDRPAGLEGHLAACAACARALALSRSLAAGLSALPRRRPGPAFDAAILAALASSSGGASFSR